MIPRLKNLIRGWLSRLQRVTGTDMLYAAKGGFWLSSGSVVGTLASLAVVVAFANLAPKETYGSYKYLMAIAGTLAGFTLTGLGEALMGAAARGNDGTLRMFVRRAFRWNLAISAVAFAGAVWYFWRGNAMLGAALVSIAAFLPMTHSAVLYGPFLAGKRLFQVSARYSAARALVPAVALIAALRFFPDHPAALVSVFMGAMAVTTYAAYRLVLRTRVKNDSVEPGALRYGKHVSLVNALGAFAANFDKIVIFQTLGAAPTAVYALAQALPDQVDAVFSHLRTLAIPKFAARTPQGSFKALLRKTAIVALILVLVTAAAAGLAPFAYGLLFPAYQDAVPYAIALLAAQIPIGAAHLPMAFLTAHQDIRSRYALGLIGPAANIVLLLALIAPFGIWGVVAAKILSKFFGLFLAILFSWRLTRSSAPSFMPPAATPPASS